MEPDLPDPRDNQAVAVSSSSASGGSTSSASGEQLEKEAGENKQSRKRAAEEETEAKQPKRQERAEHVFEPAELSDLTLKSNDGVTFRVHSQIVAKTCKVGVFEFHLNCLYAAGVTTGISRRHMQDQIVRRRRSSAGNATFGGSALPRLGCDLRCIRLAKQRMARKEL